jgi:hypothetical protein
VKHVDLGTREGVSAIRRSRSNGFPLCWLLKSHHQAEPLGDPVPTDENIAHHFGPPAPPKPCGRSRPPPHIGIEPVDPNHSPRLLALRTSHRGPSTWHVPCASRTSHVICGLRLHR